MFDHLRAWLQAIELQRRPILHEYGRWIAYIYFIERRLASALTRGEVVKKTVSQSRRNSRRPVAHSRRSSPTATSDPNLIMNAVQAMIGVSEGSRELLISTGKDASSGVLVAVQDTGSGLDPENSERLFDHPTRPSPAAWARDFRSVVQSSKVTENGYGRLQTCLGVLHFNSHCQHKAYSPVMIG
jgi:hypothetical protein